MKYCIVIGDGMADEPHPRLAGRTPLEAARTPHMDALAREGALGLVHTCPARFEPGSDVANLTICGYDPARWYTGRAPLEALAAGIALGPDDLVFRCNLVATFDNQMADYSAGHISNKEARLLVEALNRELGGNGLEFVAGNSYRNLLVVRGAGEVGIETTPPHNIPGQPIEPHLPRGKGAARFRELMLRSRRLLEEHDINVTRRDLEENPANMAWLWGQGKSPSLPAFRELFGLAGAAISAVDVIRGIARGIGWTVLEVPGITGYVDTNYKGKGEAALAALETHDLVYVHVEAPDETSHEGDVQKKVWAIEAIDRDVLGTIRAGIRAPYRLAVLPDHPTSLLTRVHLRDPVPFAVAGEGVPASGAEAYSEAAAARTKNVCKPGTDWMPAFLGREG